MFMRIVCVSDIHWDEHCLMPRYSYPSGISQASLLDEVISFANGDVDGVRADMFVDLGDRIQQQGLSNPHLSKGDCDNIYSLSKHFNRLNHDIECVFLDGNHDGALLSSDSSRILGRDVGSRVLDFDQFRCVFWGASVRNDKAIDGYTATQDDLVWLKDNLRADKPVLLGTHIPLDGMDPVGLNTADGRFQPFVNPFYNNKDEILDVVQESGTVLLAVSGHLHRYKRMPLVESTHLNPRVAKTQFLRLASLTRPWTKGAATVIDVTDRGFDISSIGEYSLFLDTHGDTPEPFSLDFPAAA
ncbi:MAG: metallophosphoesterase [Bdellovibrionales bacterium]